LVAAIEAALAERQALLRGPDTAETRDRRAAIGLRLAGLLDQLAALVQPEAPSQTLEDFDDQATLSTETESDFSADAWHPTSRAG
jgi:hypothetical protein